MKILRPKAAIVGNTGPSGETIDKIYGCARLEHIRQHTDLYPTQINSSNIEAFLPDLHDLKVIFSTWGMFPFSPEQLSQLPQLQAVFYAAGTIKHFAIPFLERGVTVVSAAPANAVPVAEFALGQILLANKGYFGNVEEYRVTPDYNDCYRGFGNYGATVSILGAGQIGRKLIELLRPFHMKVLVFDPFLSDKAIERLGAQKVATLKEAFKRGEIVSNHLAEVPATRGMLRGHHFSAMPIGATFINTGRGKTVNHDELVEVFGRRTDLTALLDVTEPEPLPLGHPLRSLPNVRISGHIAGSIGNEVGRMVDLALADFERWMRGEALHYAVTLQMLEQMA